MASPSEQRVWVGFDLGGTKMLSVVYDEAFEPQARARKKTKAHDGVRAGIHRIAATIREALDEAHVEIGRVGAVGIGAPGPIDMENGLVVEAPNLGVDWQRVPLAQSLEEELGCPVVLCNDVDAGVFGEYVFGAGRGARCVVGVFPGTGIGGGCVYEGRILHGGRITCMEVGHIPVLPEGPLCGCGQRGCLEAVASRVAIAAEAAAAARRGQAPRLQRRSGSDLGRIRSGVLAEMIHAGEATVERIVRSAAVRIGTTLAGVIHLLAPDVIVLGGGLVEAMPELFVSEVHEAAKSRVMPAYRDTFRVVAAELGDDAAVLGAAAWARRLRDAET